jgi:cellulose synthase/poly-beta-1,6-N-acetylglucosamine synthase-like glycosyltransferase
MALLIFWICIGVLVYVYAGYPLLVIVAGKLRNKRVRCQEITPPITLLITAFNEEQGIRERLENALSLDYPSENLEIIVASDGSTDRTVEIAREFESMGVRVLEMPRRGKIHAMNAAVGYATGDILVFSDATSMYRPDALRKLARNYADPEVGGVSGIPQFIVNPASESSASGERLYFSYDSFLKLMESRSGSTVAGGGCMLSIRRQIYQPMPAYVTDDFAISMSVIESGGRLVWEPEAVALEEPAVKSNGEFQRKVRMMTRGFRSLILHKGLLNPLRYGWYSICLFSHKFLRNLVPLFLIALLATSAAALADGYIYRVTFVAQICFYLLAIMGLRLTHTKAGRSKLLAIPFFYCMANGAAFVALWKVFSGARIESWQPQRPQHAHRFRIWLIGIALFFFCLSLFEWMQSSPVPPVKTGIWLNADEIRQLPTDGLAWKRLKTQADLPEGFPNLSDMSEKNNWRVLAKALVYARTGIESYRSEVIDQSMRVIGTEQGGATLALGRKLAAYVIAADIVGLPEKEDKVFREWLRSVLDEPLNGWTLRTTHEKRANNWGTHAGASRAAVARYLNDPAEVARVAQVFKGWLGDRSVYSGFRIKYLEWQCDPANPVGINPKNCMKDGHSVDGVLPDDQMRSGGFTWPPPKENYVYEALQGAIVTAHILDRAGYDTFEWQDRALLRAYVWLRDEADYPASGDNVWELPIVDFHYKTRFWDEELFAWPGKNMGFTDWAFGENR